MRIFDSLPAIGIALMAGQAFGQLALPGKPEDNGVRPVSDTLYLNTSDTLNNTKTESIGIGIARNGNVLFNLDAGQFRILARLRDFLRRSAIARCAMARSASSATARRS